MATAIKFAEPAQNEFLASPDERSNRASHLFPMANRPEVLKNFAPFYGSIMGPRAAIEYARELTRTADAAQTRDALETHCNDEQIVEITLIAALANFTNGFNNGLDLVPEQ